MSIELYDFLVPDIPSLSLTGIFAAVGILCAIVLVVRGISKGGFSLSGGKPLFRAQSNEDRVRDFKSDLVIGIVLVIILLVVAECTS